MHVWRWVKQHARRYNRLVLLLPCLLLFVGSGYNQNHQSNHEQGHNVLEEERRSESYKFKDFDVDQWNSSQRVALVDDDREYFRDLGNATCFIRGTNWEKSAKLKECACERGYFGPHCGIPQSAWESHFKSHKRSLYKLKPRKTPRRIVHGLQVNHELDLYEARLEILKDVVDVYIMLESNYSSYGEPKPLTFLQKLQTGWMSRYQDSLLYVLLPFFPKAGESNGWYADAFLRLYLGKAGIKLVDNLRDDDIFLLLDADELPTAEALLFLKLFDGWKEPVQFGFRWTVFGFFWVKAEEPGWAASLPLVGQLLPRSGRDRLLTLYTACTIGMLREGR